MSYLNTNFPEFTRGESRYNKPLPKKPKKFVPKPPSSPPPPEALKRGKIKPPPSIPSPVGSKVKKTTEKIIKSPKEDFENQEPKTPKAHRLLPPPPLSNQNVSIEKLQEPGNIPGKPLPSTPKTVPHSVKIALEQNHKDAPPSAVKARPRGSTQLDPAINYSLARSAREKLEETQLRPLLKKDEKLLENLVATCVALRQEMPLKERLELLNKYADILISCEWISKSHSEAWDKIKEAFKQELNAFVVLEAFSYRHFESQRKKIEKSLWEQQYLNLNETEFIQDWKKRRKSLDMLEDFESQQKMKKRRFGRTIDSFERRDFELKQHANHIELYRQMKEYALEKAKKEFPNNDQMKLTLQRQILGLKELQKALKVEQLAVDEYLQAQKLLKSFS